LLAGAAEIARGAFEIGWQVGDAGLNHRIDDALRREEGKAERGIVPDGGVEARVPRGKGCAAFEGCAKLVWRAVPIKNCTVGVPSKRRRVADGIGQDEGARRRRGDVPEGSGGLQIERAAKRFKIDPAKIVGFKRHGTRSEKSGEAAAQSASPLIRRARTRAGFTRRAGVA